MQGGYTFQKPHPAHGQSGICWELRDVHVMRSAARMSICGNPAIGNFFSQVTPSLGSQRLLPRRMRWQI